MIQALRFCEDLLQVEGGVEAIVDAAALLGLALTKASGDGAAGVWGAAAGASDIVRRTSGSRAIWKFAASRRSSPNGRGVS